MKTASNFDLRFGALDLVCYIALFPTISAFFIEDVLNVRLLFPVNCNCSWKKTQIEKRSTYGLRGCNKLFCESEVLREREILLFFGDNFFLFFSWNIKDQNQQFCLCHSMFTDNSKFSRVTVLLEFL